MWEVPWLISNENQVSISQALKTRHKVTTGWGKRSRYPGGLMGGRIAWNCGSQFSIKSQLKVSQGYMDRPLVCLKMKLLIHLSISKLKGIKHDHDSHSSITLYHPEICELSLRVALSLITHRMWSHLRFASTFSHKAHKSWAQILASTHPSTHHQILMQ